MDDDIMLKTLLGKLFNKLKRIAEEQSVREALSELQCNKNISLSDTPHVKGAPLIDIRKGGLLKIGRNVTLNSNNGGYHINMHSPVKLFADRPGASITIGDNTRLHGSCVHAYGSISIGQNCLIAANCHIIDGNGHDMSYPDVSNRINTTGKVKPVVIEDDVWICANTIVLPGVTIGRGSIISANSVVTSDIPPMVVAGGNPAVVLRRLDGDRVELNRT
jgi:acetyltransferase-like isoleucine patch superfamily enzyme